MKSLTRQIRDSYAPWRDALIPEAGTVLPYHDPDVEGDAQSQVHCRQDDGPFELMEQQVDQAGLEDESVEEHEEDDDDVEEDGNILDAVGEREGGELPGTCGDPAIPGCRHSHEEHELDDGRSAQQLREGVDEEVVEEQQELQGEHHAVAAGLQHHLSPRAVFSVAAFRAAEPPHSRGPGPPAPPRPTDAPRSLGGGGGGDVGVIPGKAWAGGRRGTLAYPVPVTLSPHRHPLPTGPHSPDTAILHPHGDRAAIPGGRRRDRKYPVATLRALPGSETWRSRLSMVLEDRGMAPA